MNAIERLKEYKNRLQVGRLEYGMNKLYEFKQNMPEELAEVNLQVYLQMVIVLTQM